MQSSMDHHALHIIAEAGRRRPLPGAQALLRVDVYQEALEPQDGEEDDGNDDDQQQLAA